MRAYIIRRLLLVPLTLLGITLLVFSMTRFLPGGPMEQALQRVQAGEGRAGRFGGNQAGGLSSEQKEAMRMQFRMNDSWFIGYLRWLGVLHGEILPRFVPFAEGEKQAVVLLGYVDNNGRAYSRPAVITQADPPTLKLQDSGETPEGWNVRYGQNQKEDSQGFVQDKSRAVVFRTARAGLLQGDFGDSLLFGDPVLKMVRDRLPISLLFGLTTLLVTYLVSIPLGIVKAIRHRTWLDSSTSVLLFIGYAIPGFVLGTLLYLLFAFRLQWLPMGGFTSPNFSTLPLSGKVWDVVQHAIMPLTCYIVPSFAITTLLMKNNLMDVLAADFVRTAVAKGVPFRRAVVGHAVRHAIIPIAATLGQSITVIVGGSFLIEQVFDINGFGLLGFESAVHRDYTVVMGILVLSSTLLLVGNILSDIFLALLNPRIRFD